MARQKKATRDAKTELYSATLICELTREEVEERAKRAAHTISDRDEKEAEAKAHQKQMKSVIEELEATHRRLSNEVRTGNTYRLVECERIFDFEEGQLIEKRLDTGEELTRRSLTESERQKELPFREEDHTEE